MRSPPTLPPPKNLKRALDVEKAFDNVWHSGLRYKIYQLDLPTKLCRWLSGFLVGRVIQVKIEGQNSNKGRTCFIFVRPIFEYGIVSTITVSDTVITKIQRVQNSFIRLALHLPKYVSARLLYEASGLPYVRERLITIGQNHLARMHSNPLVEQTINSARTNIARDKYKTSISILQPLD